MPADLSTLPDAARPQGRPWKVLPQGRLLWTETLLQRPLLHRLRATARFGPTMRAIFWWCRPSRHARPGPCPSASRGERFRWSSLAEPAQRACDPNAMGRAREAGGVNGTRGCRVACGHFCPAKWCADDPMAARCRRRRARGLDRPAAPRAAGIGSAPEASAQYHDHHHDVDGHDDHDDVDDHDVDNHDVASLTSGHRRL
jgi:hypothetical protein